MATEDLWTGDYWTEIRYKLHFGSVRSSLNRFGDTRYVSTAISIQGEGHAAAGNWLMIAGASERSCANMTMAETF